MPTRYGPMTTSGAGPLVLTTAAITRQRQELMEHWRSGVWAWLSGVDTTTHETPLAPDRYYPHGVPLIWTTDEKDNEHPVKPFPVHLDYLRLYVETIVSTAPEDRTILIEKCRQMLASTGILLAFDWMCRTKDSRRILWSKINEKDAAEMLQDKVRAVHERLPLWVQEESPIKMKPYRKIPYLKTRSYMLAVNQVAAKTAARGGSASAIGVDECAYQDYFEDIFIAAQPMAAKLVALTTWTVGPPGAQFFYEKVKDGRLYRPAVPAA